MTHTGAGRGKMRCAKMRYAEERRQAGRRARRAKVIACGLMSGTSRDGIDVALVEITGAYPRNSVRLLHAQRVAYPGWLRRKLLEEPEGFKAHEVAGLDFAVGDAFGRAALRALRRAGFKPAEVDIIGSHGQTLAHLPQGASLGTKVVRSTLQVGNGAVIAQATGIPTVADFRAADLAVGGEGAPLVPAYDYVMLRSETRSRVALNIGGIANLTALRRNARPGDLICFDTGPGNCVLDVAARHLTRGRAAYDRGGRMARQGNLDAAWMRRILAHPYFKRKPPKSTGWEEFGEAFTRRLLAGMMAGRRDRASDVMRTLTEAVAESIVMAIARFVAPAMRPDEVIVTGGGSRNGCLMRCLRERLLARFPGIVVERGEAFGIDSDAKEACAFAYLAYLCLEGIPGNLMSQAAGLRPAVLGALYPAPSA